MIYLCYNTLTNNLSIENKLSSSYFEVLISPFDMPSNNGKKEKTYDIVVPNSNFKIHLIARYNSYLSEITISDNNRDFYQMSAILHHKGKIINDNDLRKILVKIKGENDESGWRLCFNSILDIYNNRTIWQVNEVHSMMADMNELYSEGLESYSIKSPTNKNYEGIDLSLLKAKKLMQCLKWLQENDMVNLSFVKDDIITMCIKTLPMLRNLYLTEFEGIKQLEIEFNDAEKRYNLCINANEHLKEYREFMINNKYSFTEENAKIRFRKKYPSEYDLIESLSNIQKDYFEKMRAWGQICDNSKIVEECYKCIFDFMYKEGKFAEFLKTENVK